MPYDPQQQAAVDAYLQGGGNQAAVDAYFAGNPSQEQFLQDAGNYWNVEPPAPYSAPPTPAPPVDPNVAKFNKLKGDVSAYYLQNGGNQADIDAYFAQNPSYEQLATDAARAYTEHLGDDVQAKRDVYKYFGLPAPANDPYLGTGLKPDGTVSNTGPYAPGSGDPMRDPWEVDYKYVDPQGNPRPGYAFGLNGQIVKLQGGTAFDPNATAPQAQGEGEPSIFDMFQNLINSLQQQQPQAPPKDPNWYFKNFKAGGANDPMVVQNAIANQTDPASAAGLFKSLYENFNTMQQQQGGSQAIMPALDQPGQAQKQYTSQYVAPPPPPPVAPAPKMPKAPKVPMQPKLKVAKDEYQPGF